LHSLVSIPINVYFNSLQIGLVIRRFLPKVANVLAKMLKPIGKHRILLILCLKNCCNDKYFVFMFMLTAGIFVCVIIGFGIYANLYMIQLMDWRVNK